MPDGLWVGMPRNDELGARNLELQEGEPGITLLPAALPNSVKPLPQLHRLRTKLEPDGRTAESFFHDLDEKLSRNRHGYPPWQGWMPERDSSRQPSAQNAPNAVASLIRP
jgi:hypothetical protein